LKNAIKFTPVGGRVFVRTRTEFANERQWLAIEVEDTGIGITPEILPRVFGAFQQGDRSITQQFGGLGLGLAISKAIVEAHGGAITAASLGPNKGATFTVHLPVSNYPTAAVEIVSERQSSSLPERTAEFINTHLLLVEDHPDTAHVMARMLRRAGFEVTVASNIAQALAETEVARKTVDENGRCWPIRLVISDLGLPDGTGFELMRKLQTDFRLRGIALSGFGMEDDVKQAAAAGFDRHLTKPVDFEQLLASIRELLARE
jgi:CheY-like chemotaxis protein